ncbi:MAG: VIT1/CCC1 transporter family protein [Candidatus Bathyarchaeota archaeon]|nr:VIT1/CCC1 transporter family protein [Candidatus Bathyarchaeota archaeon]MCX8177575.1 VIT1/CCC1 transporter family protein [Candidatus Bathyarchaeota archaeon]
MLDKKTEKAILAAQMNELTEHFIYEKLAQSIKDLNNREVLRNISKDELKHYEFWRKITKKDVKPNRLKVWGYFLISKIFGITFGVKIMERGEEKAQATYGKISKLIPDARNIVEDEDEHERQLMNLIDEERLRYVGSMVLGLNDALVELTGALAGFTLALQNTRVVAMTGLITGVAAALSMATSEYLSIKSEGNNKNPIQAATYTGIAYILTVLFLIFPYLLISDAYACLGLTITAGITVIFMFTFYISVAKDLPFKRRFLEMTAISLSVAGLTFIIGFFIKAFLNLELD